MQQEAVDKKALEAKSSEVKMNEMIKDYTPFIISCLKDIKGSFVDTANDDEYSIGLISFEKAIKTYDKGKGSFLSYARIVIRRSIIDYLRKMQREKKIIYLEDYNDENAYEGFCENNIINERAEEIQRLKKELLQYGIKFDELVDVSPKHKRIREICREVIKLVSDNKELLYILRKTGKLPMYEIERDLLIKRRRFERSRKYIIAGVLILTGEYEYISEYILLEGK